MSEKFDSPSICFERAEFAVHRNSLSDGCLSKELDETPNDSGASLVGVDEVIYVDEYRIVFIMENSLFQMEFSNGQDSYGRGKADAKHLKVEEKESPFAVTSKKLKYNVNDDCLNLNNSHIDEFSPIKNSFFECFENENSFDSNTTSLIDVRNCSLNNSSTDQSSDLGFNDGTWKEIDNLYKHLLECELGAGNPITKNEPTTFEIINQTQLSDILGESLSDILHDTHGMAFFGPEK